MWELLCLDQRQLHALAELATRCEQVYGPDRDIEWAWADGRLYLLQCRAVTRAGTATSDGSLPRQEAPTESLAQVPLLAGLDPAEMRKVAAAFKQRRFRAGETVTKEGAGAAACFVIDSGSAAVTVQGAQRATLGPGDFFGEVAILGDGRRSATVTTTSPARVLVLFGTEFRRLEQEHPAIAEQLQAAMQQRLAAHA
jgi:hypothetical protein